MKIIKNLFIVLAFISLLFLVNHSVNSQVCNKDNCESLIKETEQKLAIVRSQKNSLSAEIQYMDSQIYLTTLRIQNTQQQINDTEAEIETLGGRIEGVNSSLDYLTKLLFNKIKEGYKRRDVPLFNIFLDSESASTLLNQLKYAQTAQENDRRVAYQLQQAKQNFEDQKDLREKKKIELDNLNAALASEKANLNSQKADKQRLLIETQNSESIYQGILQSARAQLSAFSSFARTSGAFSTIAPGALGSGSDGNYFSQRDSRWASQIIGNSTYDCNGHPCSNLEAGCLISSVAMVSKKKGINLDPGIITSDTNYFSANTALMKFSLPTGLNRHEIYSASAGFGSLSDVDSQIQQGNYVIAGINYGGCGSYSDHFVVLISGSEGNYQMHDPIYGPDIPFSSHYSQVCWAEVLQ